MKKQKVFILAEQNERSHLVVTDTQIYFFGPVIEKEGYFLTPDELKELIKGVKFDKENIQRTFKNISNELTSAKVVFNLHVDEYIETLNIK